MFFSVFFFGFCWFCWFCWFFLCFSARISCLTLNYPNSSDMNQWIDERERQTYGQRVLVLVLVLVWSRSRSGVGLVWSWSPRPPDKRKGEPTADTRPITNMFCLGFGLRCLVGSLVWIWFGAGLVWVWSGFWYWFSCWC